MPKALTLIATVLTTFSLSAQTIILEENFSGGIPANWQVIDVDGFANDASLIGFNSEWIGYIDGTDTCAATSSFFQDTIAESEDFLILPKLSLQSFNKFSWDARSVDASYPEGYHILISTSDSSISSFTDTLLTVGAEYFDWNRRTIVLDDMGYANQDVYLAFSHHSQNGFILEIDNVLVEVSDFVSESELIIDEETTLYPNPSVEYVTVAAEKYVYTTIHSINGAMLIHSKEKIIDVSELAVGTYYVIIRTEQGSHTKPFIKK